jgi:hypothetical protein
MDELYGIAKILEDLDNAEARCISAKTAKEQVQGLLDRTVRTFVRQYIQMGLNCVIMVNKDCAVTCKWVGDGPDDFEWSLWGVFHFLEPGQTKGAKE